MGNRSYLIGFYGIDLGKRVEQYAQNHDEMDDYCNDTYEYCNRVLGPLLPESLYLEEYGDFVGGNTYHALAVRDSCVSTQNGIPEKRTDFNNFDDLLLDTMLKLDFFGSTFVPSWHEKECYG